MKLFRSAVLAAALVAGSTGNVFGFELLRVDENTCGNARNLRWDPAEVRYDTQTLSASEQSLFEEAVDEWRNVLGSRLRFESVVGEDPPCQLTNGITSVAFTQVDCQGDPFPESFFALTVTTWEIDSGRIVDADISFNPEVNFSNDDFRQVAMHELGHVFGLDHSDACGDSGVGTLMRARLVEPTLFSPQQDDINGARAIYGSGEVGVPAGANECAVGAPSKPGIDALATWLLVIGALVWRKRQAKRALSG